MSLTTHIRANVKAALEEDIGTLSPSLSLERKRGTGNREAMISDGDLTAQLIPAGSKAKATVITREDAVLCGTLWFEECFLTLDPDCRIEWKLKEGERANANQPLCEIHGDARALLSAERPALNFLQTLSAVATVTRRYVEAAQGHKAKIMDTRKTLPGLRHAQKYAVTVGGGHNQRTGLFDGVLIKENHIAAAGGIGKVMELAFQVTPPHIPIQIEVESMAELDEALLAGAQLILLDNFSVADMQRAVEHAAGRAELEASGGITLENIPLIAATGVDRISIGALTKDVKAIDLSMRVQLP
jgi:nicotinate-nucleotide pyrophosphorylase (carboxylating)